MTDRKGKCDVRRTLTSILATISCLGPLGSPGAARAQAAAPVVQPAAVVGAGASTAAPCSTAWQWSCVPPDACTRRLVDGDTGPIGPGNEWIDRMTIRPGGSVCAHWDSADIEGSLVGPGLQTAGSGSSVLTGTGLPGGTYTLTLRPVDSATGPAHTRVEVNVS
jgi:hypothetical protein